MFPWLSNFAVSVVTNCSVHRTRVPVKKPSAPNVRPFRTFLNKVSRVPPARNHFRRLRLPVRLPTRCQTRRRPTQPPHPRRTSWHKTVPSLASRRGPRLLHPSPSIPTPRRRPDFPHPRYRLLLVRSRPARSISARCMRVVGVF